MKNKIKLALIAAVSVVLSSCGGFGHGNDPEFKLSDLQGLWLENNDPTEHFVRFTTEQSDEEGYLYGREWNEYHGDEDQAVYESDLFESLQTLGVHGNGWFKYKLETKGDLEEIHLMDNGGAEQPKEYIVSVLTDERLEYYEKDNKSRKFSFDKVVETAK